MELLEIPISSSDPHFVQQNQIFTNSFFLEFEYLERAKFWVMHIFDSEQNSLDLGIKILPDWPLFSHKDFVLVLLKKSPRAQLNRFSLATDFMLVAHETI